MSRAWDVAVQDFDIVAAAARGGVSLDEYYGEELHGDCPFCSDSRGRLGVNTVKGVAHCFNCGWAGGYVALLQQLLGLTYEAATGLILAGRNRRRGLAELPTVTQISSETRGSRDVELPSEFEPLVLPETARSRGFWRYLRARRYAPDLIQSYGIGFARSGWCAWRVIVPIMVDGRLASYVARAVDDSVVPKYRSPPGSNNADLLFNLERLVGREDVVLMEGVFDALRLPDLAVATLGAHLSQAQRTLLMQMGFRRAIFCWDEDDTGLPQAYEAARALQGRMEVLQATLPEGADPGRLSVAALRAAIRDARPPVGRGAFRRTVAQIRPNQI